MPFNPFEAIPISGSWEDHASYSAGGTDLPLAYRTPIYAPARGHLYTSGRPPGVNASNEWQCGWVGTAGRRSILMLEKAIERPIGGSRRLTPPEGSGPMVAIVFQHQAEFSPNSGPNTLYLENGGPIGFSGASANGDDWGGQVHLHWHGLNAAGQRLRVEAFLNRTSNAAGGDGTPIEEAPPIVRETEMYFYYQTQGNLTSWILWIPGKSRYQTTQSNAQALKWRALCGKDATRLSDEEVAELDNVRAIFA